MPDPLERTRRGPPQSSASSSYPRVLEAPATRSRRKQQPCLPPLRRSQAPLQAPIASPAKAPPAVSGMPSIVVLDPKEPREFPAQADRPAMDQITQTFVPAILFVRTGQADRFQEQRRCAAQRAGEERRDTRRHLQRRDPDRADLHAHRSTATGSTTSAATFTPRCRRR